MREAAFSHFAGLRLHSVQHRMKQPSCLRRPRACMAPAAETLAWAREIVVGLNLCPFAGNVLDTGRVRIRVDDGAVDEESVRKLLTEETKLLLAADAETLETTLVVVPQFSADDFVRWHTFCTELESDIEADNDLVDKIMVACFHPLYKWGDISERDALHFDKRAPHPVVNILRAATVDEAIQRGETQQILARNAATLEQLGYDDMTRRYEELKVSLGDYQA